MAQIVTNINYKHQEWVYPKTIKEICNQKVGFLSKNSNIQVAKQQLGTQKIIKKILKKNTSEKLYYGEWKILKLKNNRYYKDKENLIRLISKNIFSDGLWDNVGLAIKVALDNLGNSLVKIRVLSGAVGAISESDITLASASSALVFAFNVRAIPQARELSRRDNVEIRYHSIIYELIEDAKLALTGMLDPDLQETFIGYAEIRKIFSVSKIGKIAGCFVNEGVVKKGCSFRLLRDNTVIHQGMLKTLRRFK